MSYTGRRNSDEPVLDGLMAAAVWLRRRTRGEDFCRHSISAANVAMLLQTVLDRGT